jgi:hypothetical protein
MSTPTATVTLGAEEQALLTGNLSTLSEQQRGDLYTRVCASVGLNPFTRPFDYITLNNRLVLYAKKDATDQLRKLHGVSITAIEQVVLNDVLFVTVKAQDRTGRTDIDLGAVSIAGLRGDGLANQTMRAITKGKRRVTLSICGLGMLDESEVEPGPAARVAAPVAPRQLTARTTSAQSESPDHDTQLRLWKRIDAAQQALLALDPSATLKEHPSSQAERTRYWQEADAYVAQLEEAARLLEDAAALEEEVSPI